MTRLALFDLDGTLLAGDTDVLWCAFLVDEGVLDRDRFGAANREVAERYARGVITPDEFAGFYAATLAGRSAAAWAPLRARFVASAIEPRIAAASRSLVAQHRVAGDRLVLTTATNRFLSEPIAASLGIAELIATELDVAANGDFSGRTSGVVNMRAGKVARLASWLAAQGEGDVDAGRGDLLQRLDQRPAAARSRRHAGRRRSRPAPARGSAAPRLARPAPRLIGAASQSDAARQSSAAPLPSRRIQTARAASRGASRPCRRLPAK